MLSKGLILQAMWTLYLKIKVRHFAQNSGMIFYTRIYFIY